MKIKLLILLMVVAIFPAYVCALQGMPTPMLHVEGRYLKKNPMGRMLHYVADGCSQRIPGLMVKEGGMAIRQIGTTQVMWLAC